MRVRQTRDTRGDMETANIRILPLASVNPRFLVSLMLSVHLTTFSSSLIPSSPRVPSHFGPEGPASPVRRVPRGGGEVKRATVRHERPVTYSARFVHPTHLSHLLVSLHSFREPKAVRGEEVKDERPNLEPTRGADRP